MRVSPPQHAGAEDSRQPDWRRDTRLETSRALLVHVQEVVVVGGGVLYTSLSLPVRSILPLRVSHRGATGRNCIHHDGKGCTNVLQPQHFCCPGLNERESCGMDPYDRAPGLKTGT
jgi:hypothetical protein